MQKIYVLHENNDWTRHLQQRLEKLQLPFEMWHLDQGCIDLSSAPPHGVFYNRISASSHTRNHRFAPELTEAVLAWLERHNRTVVNGSRALRLELSKANQYMGLNQAGIATPKTFVTLGTEALLDAAKHFAGQPFITKHNRAGKGQGVKLFHSSAALADYVHSAQFEQPVDGITLVQQYIQAPQPFIVRHEFIGGKFFYAVKVDTSAGFELCPADACAIDDLACPAGGTDTAAKFEILSDYRPEFIDRYEAFLQHNQVGVAAIESIVDSQGNSYAYDVNTNTNYNSDAEQQAGKYAMLELAHYLHAQLPQ